MCAMLEVSLANIVSCTSQIHERDLFLELLSQVQVGASGLYGEEGGRRGGGEVGGGMGDGRERRRGKGEGGKHYPSHISVRRLSCDYVYTIWKGLWYVCVGISMVTSLCSNDRMRGAIIN